MEEPVKNPGRVAWGKKLAKMSKELKEKKKAALAEPEVAEKEVDEKPAEQSTRFDRIGVVIGLAGLAIAVYAMFGTTKVEVVKIDEPRSWKDQAEPRPVEPVYDYRKF